MHRFLLLAITLIASHTLADDAATNRVAAARTAHKLQLATARETLLAALDDEIAAAAERADLEGVRKQVKAKRAFREKLALPTAEPLKEAVRTYVEERRKADGTLLAAWKAEIERVTAAGELKTAAALQTEMREFAASEAPFLAKATLVERRATKDATGSKAIMESLQEIITEADERHAALAKIQREEPAALAKEIVGKQLHEMSDSLNQRLKKTRWTLHFPIVDIRERPGERGKYDVKIEPPLETAEVNSEWKLASNWPITLTQEKASRVKRGQLLKITGTPQLVGPTVYQQGIYNRSFPLRGLSEVLYVDLANSKVEIVAEGR